MKKRTIDLALAALYFAGGILFVHYSSEHAVAEFLALWGLIEIWLRLHDWGNPPGGYLLPQRVAA